MNKRNMDLLVLEVVKKNVAQGFAQISEECKRLRHMSEMPESLVKALNMIVGLQEGVDLHIASLREKVSQQQK